MKNKVINILESAQENDATDIHIILESDKSNSSMF
ncbi:hypothetical protein SAMN05216216_11050 [Lacicoccus qingdaonensis]|uniref:Uncharacterized protein n=1 Tax=Lacicoccus qingdaonensis TaxID=576118 RepID=A0A1G9EY66_9BACL|nr:hypothetical protein SAMN05216216_11050 [Salinicoccus qingdaonensis]